MGKLLEDFEAIYGKASAEWERPCLLPLRPFLFHVYSSDASSKLVLHVTDFHFYTWGCTRSVQQLEDLRANVGIGGSISELVDYLIASLNSGNVKIVLGGHMESKKAAGATFAKLITHKSKGMPSITISLDRLTKSSASDAIGKLSWELFEAFKCKDDLVAKEQQRSYQLTKMLHAEKEKSESIQEKLDLELFLKEKENLMLSKASKVLPIATNIISLDAMPVSDSHSSLEKLPSQLLSTKNIITRPVPEYRRLKVGGVFVEDKDGRSN